MSDSDEAELSRPDLPEPTPHGPGPDDERPDDERPDDARLSAQLGELLGELRHDEVPLPPEVAARVQASLAQLAATGLTPASAHDTVADALDESDQGHLAQPAGAVLDLGAARDTRAKPWRRRAAGLLVAAAAVVALGVGVPPLLESGGVGETTSVADQAPSSDVENPTDAPADARSLEAPAPAEQPQEKAFGGAAPPAVGGAMPSLTPDEQGRLPGGASLVEHVIEPGRERSGIRRAVREWPAESAPVDLSETGLTCPAAPTVGDVLYVQYGDELAYLVTAPLSRDRVRVTLRRCGDRGAIAQVVVRQQ